MRSNISKKDNLPKANRHIVSKEVRLVGENGEMLGICELEEALQKAEKYGLDLVEISPNATPPVCKLMDFGKFKYESKKKAHDAKKKQRITVTKEIKLRPNIGENDFQVKLKSIAKFISEQDKVKITLKFKGREITHHEIGMNLLNRLVEETKDYAKAEIEPRFEGKQLLMQLAPKLS